MYAAISAVSIHLVSYIRVSCPEKNGFQFNKAENSTMDLNPYLERGKSFLKPMGMCLWFSMSSCLDEHALFVTIEVMSEWMDANLFQNP